MKYLHENYYFDIWTENTKDGFLACYRCQCGEKYCSNHIDKNEEKALLMAKFEARNHYSRNHKPK